MGEHSLGRPAGIILDAYKRLDAAHAESPAKTNKITIASGLTWEEADRQGFFPYSISPDAHPDDVPPDQVRRAMLEEGGIETPAGVKLRFKLRESAEKAYARLQRRSPQAHWSLNQIVARIQDD